MTTNSTMASDTTSKSIKATTVCHALPCKIDYTGPAPVDVYFRPTAVNTEFQAATFRGRGLLAQQPQSDQLVTGCVLSETKDNLWTTVTTFDTLTEWHHEHNSSAMSQKESRLRVALDWMDVAQALHTPIPVPAHDDRLES